MMFWFKCCPKCNHGDLYQGKDRYGRYISCLQCGYYLTEAEEVALRYTSRCGSIAHTRQETLVGPVVVGAAPGCHLPVASRTASTLPKAAPAPIA